ncbi:head-to-tail stopper [Corynebacterium phage EmiRose]|uniref:Head-to-tail stopper n=1 Tax=Corynebacterium phage EmiRose TaxID=2565372 RepID=A0A649VPG7_9CAUD|nr:head-to-tail stopper [Corynebacterium phage EmiRose]QGJ94141.1 head-to-tail stopper [Corynebacterium phage EmiRose]
MSLISHPQNAVPVIVILRKNQHRQDGSLETVEVGRVVCTGTFHEAGESDITRYESTGQAVSELQRFVTKSFPGDDLSQVLCNGVTYDVVATPRRYRNSRMTKRDVVMLTAQTQVRKF